MADHNPFEMIEALQIELSVMLKPQYLDLDGMREVTIEHLQRRLDRIVEATRAIIREAEERGFDEGRAYEETP